MANTLGDTAGPGGWYAHSIILDAVFAKMVRPYSFRYLEQAH